jgi:hypothetical protein
MRSRVLESIWTKLQCACFVEVLSDFCSRAKNISLRCLTLSSPLVVSVGSQPFGHAGPKEIFFSTVRSSSGVVRSALQSWRCSCVDSSPSDKTGYSKVGKTFSRIGYLLILASAFEPVLVTQIVSMSYRFFICSLNYVASTLHVQTVQNFPETHWPFPRITKGTRPLLRPASRLAFLVLVFQERTHVHRRSVHNYTHVSRTIR